jgi:hypothetical protein
MHSPATREKRIVQTLLLVLFLVFVITGFELVRSFIAPDTFFNLLGGEGPSAERCSYKSIASYRLSNALLAGLSLCAIFLSLPLASAKRRLHLLIPLLVLIVSFGFWYEWACSALGIS